MTETLLTLNTVLSSGAVMAFFRGRYSAGASMDELLIVRPNSFQIYGVEYAKSTDPKSTSMEILRPLLTVDLIVSIDRACHIPAISFANQTFSQDMILLVSNTLHISLYGFYGNSMALNYVELLNINLAFYLSTEGRVPLPIPKKYTMSLAAVSVIPNVSVLVCFSYRDAPTVAGQLVFLYIFNSTLKNHSLSKKGAHKEDEQIHANIILPTKNAETSQVVDIRQVCFLQSPPLYERSGDTMLPILCINGDSDTYSFELGHESVFSAPNFTANNSRVQLIKQGIKLLDGPFCMRDLPVGSILCPVHFYIEAPDPLMMYFPLAIATSDSFTLIFKMRDSYSISFRSASAKGLKALHPQATPLSIIQVENSHVFLISFDDGNICYVYLDVGQLFKVAANKENMETNNMLTVTETIYSNGIVTRSLHSRIFTTGIFTWPVYGKEKKTFRLPSSLHLSCIRKRCSGMPRSRCNTGRASLGLLEDAAFATDVTQQGKSNQPTRFATEDDLVNSMECDEILIFLGSQTLDSTITRIALGKLCTAHKLNVENANSSGHTLDFTHHDSLHQLELINPQLIQGIGAIQDLSHIESGLILTAGSHGRDGNLALMEKGMLIRNMGDITLSDVRISSVFFYYCPISTDYYVFVVSKYENFCIYRIKLTDVCIHGNIQKSSLGNAKKTSQISMMSTKSVLGLLQTTSKTDTHRSLDGQTITDFIPLKNLHDIPSLTDLDFSLPNKKHLDDGLLFAMKTLSIDSKRHVTIRLYRCGIFINDSIAYTFNSPIFIGQIFAEYVVAACLNKTMLIIKITTDSQRSPVHVLLNKHAEVQISSITVKTLSSEKGIHTVLFGLHNNSIIVYVLDNNSLEATALDSIKVPIVPFSVLLLLDEASDRAKNTSNLEVITGKLVFSGLGGYIGLIPFEVTKKKSKRSGNYHLTTSKLNESTTLKGREGRIPLQLYHILDSSTSFVVRGLRLFYATIRKEIDLTVTKSKGTDDISWRINIIRMVTRPMRSMLMVVPLPIELQKRIFNHIECHLVTPSQFCVETCDEMTRTSVYGMTTRSIEKYTDLQAQTLNTLFLVLLNGQLELNSNLNTIHTPLGASAEIIHGNAAQANTSLAINSMFGYHTVHRTRKNDLTTSTEMSEDCRTGTVNKVRHTSPLDGGATVSCPTSRYLAILLPTNEIQMSVTRYLLRRTPLQLEHDAILEHRNHFALHTEQYLSKSQLRFIHGSNFTVTNKIILGTGLICPTFKTFLLNGTVYLVASLFAGIDMGLLQSEKGADTQTLSEQDLASAQMHEKIATEQSFDIPGSELTSMDTPALSIDGTLMLEQFGEQDVNDADILKSNKIRPQTMLPRLVFWVIHENMHYQCVGIHPLHSICSSIIVDKTSSTSFCVALICNVGNTLVRYCVHKTPEMPINPACLSLSSPGELKSSPILTLDNACKYIDKNSAITDITILSSSYPELINTEKQSLFFKIPSQMIEQQENKQRDRTSRDLNLCVSQIEGSDARSVRTERIDQVKQTMSTHDFIALISAEDVENVFKEPRSTYELNITTVNNIHVIDKLGVSTIVMLYNEDKSMSIACVIGNGLISLYDSKLNLLFHDEKGICPDVKIVCSTPSALVGSRYHGKNFFRFIAVTRENIIHFMVANLEDAFMQVRSADCLTSLEENGGTPTIASSPDDTTGTQLEKTSKVTILASYPSRHNITCAHSYMNDRVHMGTDSGAVISIKANATQFLVALQNKMVSMIAEKVDLSDTVFDPLYLKKLSSKFKDCKVIDADFLNQFLTLSTELQGTIARSLNMTVDNIEEALTEIYYL